MEKKKREGDSESSWIVEGRERERGGCHPWLPLITHSLMTLFFLLLLLLFRGREGGEAVRPNQTGSYRVHNLQVGPSSSREMFVHVRLIGPSGAGHTLVVLRNSYQQIGEF